MGDLYQSSKSQRMSVPRMPETFGHSHHYIGCAPKETFTYLDMLANSIAVFASSENRARTFVLTLKAGL
jgi:hypothetical protein